MAFGKEIIDTEIKLHDEAIENVNEFVYLGSPLTTFGQWLHKGYKGKKSKGKGSYGTNKYHLE